MEVRNDGIRVRFRGFVSALSLAVQHATNFEAKIKAEGVDAHKVHEEFTAWCNAQSSDLTRPVRNSAKYKGRFGCESGPVRRDSLDQG